VYEEHLDEFDIYRNKFKDLTWVMSTGRFGVDAIDNYFKKSTDHYSVHKEFDEDIFFENESAVGTKSYVFNKFLNNNITNDELYKVIVKFIKIRQKLKQLRPT